MDRIALHTRIAEGHEADYDREHDEWFTFEGGVATSHGACCCDEEPPGHDGREAPVVP